MKSPSRLRALQRRPSPLRARHRRHHNLPRPRPASRSRTAWRFAARSLRRRRRAAARSTARRPRPGHACPSGNRRLDQRPPARRLARRSRSRNACRRPARPLRPPSLRRHSAASDSRNPRHVVESLNSLSVDIARAIDHDASVDLWRRYQRGERDVFTRRLYTLKGQQTFDEIKRKYDREPEFRTAVDRYIADFEKLLSDVARTDRDRTITQSYLTSDTGKVYTMLAHAAGRLS